VILVNGRVLAPKHLTIDAKHLTIDAKHLTIDAKHLTIDAKGVPIDERLVPDSHKFYQDFTCEVDLPASDGEIIVSVLATDKAHLSAREELRLIRSRTSDKGRLFVLSVGVSQYKNSAFNLKYASSDAQAFAAMWKLHAGSLYKDVEVTELTDERLMLKSQAELRTLFDRAGVAPGDTVVGYCHIGQQATAMLFAARLLGHPVRLYDGSFQDWSRGTDAPVDTSAAKATP